MPEMKIASKQQIEKIFDDVALTYDCVGPNFFAKSGERLIDKMPIAPGSRGLDIATGKGAVLLPMARRVGAEGNATGIDVSSGILQEAERTASKDGIANIDLRKMDAERLEFPDQTFDVVTCGFALFFFPDMEAALNEIYRVCKPGGCVGVTLFDEGIPLFDPGFRILLQQCLEYQVGVQTPQPGAFTSQEVETLLSKFGFHSIETRPEKIELVYSSVDEWWAFIMTLASRATIEELNEETRARFKDEYLAKLRPLLQQDGLHISTGVVYAQAKR
jgi:ubiquinone/menaquinone biosynthesis C-methylase UbiE